MEICFSPEELAERAGVEPTYLDRLVALRILAAHPEHGFSPGDVYRIRLVQACEQAGMSPEAIAKAIDAGRLSLSWMDLPHYRWALLSPKTFRDVANETALDLEFVLDFVQASGYPRPQPDDRIREDDVDVFPLIQMISSMIEPETILRTARVYVESIRRIADAEATLFENKLIGGFLAQGMDRVQAVDMANQFGALTSPMTEQVIVTLYRRIQERRWNEVTIEGIEEVLEDMGLYERPARPPAFSFVDLAGYTRMTDEKGDEAGARLAAEMSDMVDGVAARSGGLVVKWLGDGVMLYFRDPGPAVEATIEIVRDAPRVGLPAHAGVAAGPVVVQGGDYFGRTVNLAARIGAMATAGQTLSSADVPGLTVSDRVHFRSLGPVDLKGFAQPISVFEATVAE